MTTFVGIVVGGRQATLAWVAIEALRRAAAQPQRWLVSAVPSGAPSGALEAAHASVPTPLPLALELQSAALGRQYLLSDAQIAAAGAVLLVTEACDTPESESVQDAARLAGKPLHRVTLAQAVSAPDVVLAALYALAPTPSSPASDDVPAAAAADKVLDIVAITSCPTGIAHTFMAAEGLVQGAASLGHRIHVETQGSVGAQNRLSEAQIAAADVVVIAADTQVDKGRFRGKRLYETGTKGAIGGGAALLRRAIAEAQIEGGNPPPGQGGAAGTRVSPTSPSSSSKGASASAGVYKHLMTGVSFMLPFIVAGGLLIALSFALGGIYAFDDAHKGTLAWALFQIGAKSAFALIVPVLSGYIAYSIADRPGIAPGMVGGMLAASLSAGFLGGIVSGFLAGYIALLINRKLVLPKNLQGLKPVLIIPLLSTLAVGLLMIYVVGTPVATALHALEQWLRAMQTGSAVLLGALLGAMMAFDMGGPVNKAAYAFSTGLIASAVYTPMAATMAAGMTPPLGIALAVWLFRSRFSIEEREAGNAAGVLGLAFISEGAIPFVARDPLRVIPACMLGSALAGAISMGAGVELKVPHGGIFVLPIPNAVTHLGLYLLAIVAGTVVTALAVGLLKRPLPVPTDMPT